YEVRGFISANLAKETGFDESDLNILFEAIMNMYEHDRSASKGQMSVVSPLIIFRHVGTDSSEDGRKRQALLGCAPAHKLFRLVKVEKNPEIEYPRSYEDYLATVQLGEIPAGVNIGFKTDAFDAIVWNTLPSGDCWLKNG
ncbi:MAG: type I CRISPR-associated protein Cas7, partial [Angelakisella sp.]|nr:type I CRISPR-associated protein Cas7 [Angelakisella sp.]